MGVVGEATCKDGRSVIIFGFLFVCGDVVEPHSLCKERTGQLQHDQSERNSPYPMKKQGDDQDASAKSAPTTRCQKGEIQAQIDLYKFSNANIERLAEKTLPAI